MVKRKAYFLDADYTIKDNETYVRILVKGKKTTRLLYRHDPYFYVDAPTSKKKELLKLQAKRKDGQVVTPLRVEEVKLQVKGKPKKLLKLYCHIPPDVPLIKQAVVYPCYEYRIPFARRWMLDMQISPFDILTYERTGQLVKKILKKQVGHPELQTFAFDIETYNPLGLPREKKDPAIMISYAGKKTGVITYKPVKEKFVETVGSEKEMIERFVDIVKEENPDILFGYNSANFDLPYLEARARAAKTKLKLGRWAATLKKIRKGLASSIKLDGRIHVDIYPAVRFFGFIGVIKAQRFTLDNVAREVLGKHKVEIKKDDMWKMWDKGELKSLVEYSLADAEITYELGKMLLPLQIELATLSKLPLFDISIGSSGQLVENLLMYTATAKGIVTPSRPSDSEIKERMRNPIKGAYVKLPEPGIYENIAVMDFRGLYPSIIVSYNIDPDRLEPDAPANKCYTSPTGAKFLKKPQGLVPEVVDFLIDFRVKLKQQLKKLDRNSEEYKIISARSQSCKILTNSMYGYLGYPRARWYNRSCAESTTAYGRKHIMETIENAEKEGFDVLYSDTDSVFILYKDKKKVLRFLEEVNKKLPGKMELELEGFYPRGVFVSKKGGERGAKKKYALRAEDGRIKIRGFELVRRDWSAIAKQTQLQVLEAILKEGSKEKAVTIVREAIERLRSGEVPLEELAIITQLNKPPGSYEVTSPELSAASKGAKKGIPIEKGTVISYVITKTGKSISDKAVMLRFAKDYDMNYYIDHQLLPAVMKILKELGYDEYDLKVGGKQQNLEDFF